MFAIGFHVDWKTQLHNVQFDIFSDQTFLLRIHDTEEVHLDRTLVPTVKDHQNYQSYPRIRTATRIQTGDVLNAG